MVELGDALEALAKGGEGSVHLLCQRRPLSELCVHLHCVVDGALC